MSYAIAGAQTWRLCHPVNIYVYKNGISIEEPQLIHIPTDKKKNMSTVLEEIGNRMKLTVGYPVALYTVCGARICKTYELQMYHNYVVVTNIENRFKCVDYGNVKKPLIVIGNHSKHVRTLISQNKRYDLFCRRKVPKHLHELVPQGEKNGFGPNDIAGLGQNSPLCGILCTKIAPPDRNVPSQCCSDEVMNVERVESKTKRKINDKGCCSAFPDQELNDLAQHVRSQKKGQCGHLKNLIQRYEHVGSDIFKMFQGRINVDTDISGGTENKLDLSGNEGNADSMMKIKDEMKKIAEQSCDMAFDHYGNFIGSAECPINPKSSRHSGSIPVSDKLTNSTLHSEPLPFSNYKALNEVTGIVDGVSKHHFQAPTNSPVVGNTPTRGQTPSGSGERSLHNSGEQSPTVQTSLKAVQTSPKESSSQSPNGVQSPNGTYSSAGRVSFHEDGSPARGASPSSEITSPSNGRVSFQGQSSPTGQFSPKKGQSSPVGGASPNGMHSPSGSPKEVSPTRKGSQEVGVGGSSPKGMHSPLGSPKEGSPTRKGSQQVGGGGSVAHAQTQPYYYYF